jgi:hypothetical protein
MSNFRRFLSRRWLLASIGIAALLFGLAMLHPYPRQSLFGPKIRGKPWCVWEARICRYAHRDDYWDSISFKAMRWMGVEDDMVEWKDMNDADLLPVILHLADENDLDVRDHAVAAMAQFGKLQNATALPTLHRCLNDKHPNCRINAAWAIWLIDKDKAVIPILLRTFDEAPRSVPTKPGKGPAPSRNMDRESAFWVLVIISGEERDLFPDIIAQAQDPNQNIRCMVMEALSSFSRNGLPTLLQGLDDPNQWVRKSAADSLKKIGPEAKSTIPALQRLLNDPDTDVRMKVAEALNGIDPQRFKHLKGAGD